MQKKYDTLVLIGRFQPIHNAHLEIIKRATALTNNLIIVTGSGAQPRTYKNPFTSEERAVMIRYATMGLALNITIRANYDTIYNDQAWAVRVQQIVAQNTQPGDRVGSYAENPLQKLHAANALVRLVPAPRRHEPRCGKRRSPINPAPTSRSRWYRNPC